MRRHEQNSRATQVFAFLCWLDEFEQGKSVLAIRAAPDERERVLGHGGHVTAGGFAQGVYAINGGGFIRK